MGRGRAAFDFCARALYSARDEALVGRLNGEKMKQIQCLVVCFVLGIGGAAQALPQTVTAMAENDTGAVSVTLRLWEEVILGDVRSRCSVGFVATGDELAFVAGDTIQVRLIEDDSLLGLLNDTPWQEVVTLTPQEVSAQSINRVLDCSADLGDDNGADFELFAQVTARKDNCGLFCTYESARTELVTVFEAADDSSEEADDARAGALEVSLARDPDTNALQGALSDRVLRDDDWVRFSFEQSAQVTVEIVHVGQYGWIDGVLFDEGGAQVALGEETEEGGAVIEAALPPGEYFLRLRPAAAMDFNFYDLQVRVDDAECVPNQEESAACGNCGQRSRICGPDRRWTPFGPCRAEGDCRPGDTRSSGCGDCGSLIEVCGDACLWEARGSCEGEGECSRGAQESQSCAGGTQVRTCDNACMWREFGPCQGDECETGDVRGCYDGPEGTQDVGICAEGRQVCNLGRWGECEGAVTPGVESCEDQRDNDCDGDVDLGDEDCATATAALGDPCRASVECRDGLLCVGPPDHPAFVGGYCGDDDCRSNADCGADGLCADALGERFCLRLCEADQDCRRGYLCARLEGGAACLPPCATDAHCGDPDAPICDPSTGRCVAEGADNNGADPDNNGADPNNGDPNNGQPAPAAAPKDEGCATAPGRPQALPWALLLALLLWRRR
jgi:hypothetical protein